MSAAEFKRHALDVADWLWGAVSGGFNERQTTGQIAFDAVLSAFPIAGEMTAARDVIAQLIRMCRMPERCKEVLEWVALLLPLLAIVPLFGGLLKGIGKLLMRVGRSAAEDREVLQVIIQLCNRLGQGDAVKFIKELDFGKYRQPLIDGFNDICGRLDKALQYLQEKMKSVLPREAIEEFAFLREQLAGLQRMGSRMIPQAIKDLNDRLARIRALVVSGDLHTIVPGKKAVVRESEARLVEESGPHIPPKGKGWPKNSFEGYHHVDGWPDLRKRAKRDPDTKKMICAEIEAFSGPLIPNTLKGPTTVYRVMKPGKIGKASPWWTETLPPNSKEWREALAVIDKWNLNNFFIKYDIPPGVELKVWEGRAAEQMQQTTGQYLPGGAMQLYIEWPKDLVQVIEKLPALSTGWGKTTKRYGYQLANEAGAGAQVEKLSKSEYASKKPVIEEE
ncbi:MAG TPA: hypothetical protein VF450_08510 [Noviherbaspirillum sp.]